MTDRSLRSLPESGRWAASIYNRWVDELENLHRLALVTKQGTAGLRGKPQALEALSHYHRYVEEHGAKDMDIGSRAPTPDDLEEARELAAFAQAEVDSDFPSLNAQTVVLLWAILESIVHDFAAGWLANKPNPLSCPALDRIKIPASAAISVPKEELPDYLTELLDREVSAGLRKGVKRFESLLTAVDLGGSAPGHVARGLFELAQVRNNVVHQAMRVDRELSESCPWLQLETGSKLRIHSTQVTSYMRAAVDYMIVILKRVGIKYGVEIRSKTDPAS